MMRLSSRTIRHLFLSMVLTCFGAFSLAETAVEVIYVGTEGVYNPFSYQNEQGELTGYDLEVLRAIAKRDPSLQFEFIASPWDTLFPGLDAGRFQMLAQQIVSNPDRQKRYYLTQQPYFKSVSQLIVKEGRQDIQSLQDLKGKKVASIVGSSHTRALEDWNAANGNIFTITYYDSDITMILQDIANGRIDATINDPIMAKDKAKSQGLKVSVVGEPIVESPTYFIFSKTPKGKALQEKIDGVLKEMHADGSLSRLSVEWFGEDYTK